MWSMFYWGSPPKCDCVFLCCGLCNNYTLNVYVFCAVPTSATVYILYHVLCIEVPPKVCIFCIIRRVLRFSAKCDCVCIFCIMYWGSPPSVTVCVFKCVSVWGRWSLSASPPSAQHYHHHHHHHRHHHCQHHHHPHSRYQLWHGHPLQRHPCHHHHMQLK